MPRISFPYFPQYDSMDCGPACLRMIAEFHGKRYTLQELRKRSYIDRRGVSLKGLYEAAESIGFRSLAAKVEFSAGSNQPSLMGATLPVIAHWNQKHFVVLYKLNKSYAWIADPASGKHKIKIDNFKKHWISDENRGVVLLLETTPKFFENNDDDSQTHKNHISFFKSYIRPHSKLILQLILGLILSSCLQLIFPFLTQSIIDVGIENQDVNFIYLVLLGQLTIFAGQICVRLVQNWLLLHISTRINIHLITDYLFKLMRLPLSFFDARNTGDLLQRVNDHRRIEAFLTTSSLSIFLSLVNLLIFGFVLLFYSIPIFWLYIISSVFYIIWIIIFLKKRREIDYLGFQQLSDSQSSLIEIIQGMQEIKLQGSQLKRRWNWISIQAKLFRIQIKSLTIAQYQDIGGLSISQLKDILITFLAAKSVIDGNMTLGMMLAIQFIVGQLNGPLQQLINFIRSAQDAKISYERLNEVHSFEDELSRNGEKLNAIPGGDIYLKNVHFQYSPISEEALKNISFSIPRGKITAIVGTSGSGKTTLIKLLLGFYPPTKGKIELNNVPINLIETAIWRSNCGAVMQDGFIFSDSIAANIAESDEDINIAKVVESANSAAISDYINTLPLSFNTIIGQRGNGISQGQKQRILIARAIYKNPEFLFLDEATNALDALTESEIVQNLHNFYSGRTVIIVAHRLSTVRNANKIVVLEKGEVVELGTHTELINKKGKYYQLVSNQLELGA